MVPYSWFGRTEAVGSPEDSAGLFTALLDRFAALGGVDLPLPARDEPARAADFTMGNV